MVSIWFNRFKKRIMNVDNWAMWREVGYFLHFDIILCTKKHGNPMSVYLRKWKTGMLLHTIKRGWGWRRSRGTVHTDTWGHNTRGHLCDYTEFKTAICLFARLYTKKSQKHELSPANIGVLIQHSAFWDLMWKLASQITYKQQINLENNKKWISHSFIISDKIVKFQGSNINNEESWHNIWLQQCDY